MTDEAMENNLWSLANGVVSFAVIQALAFLYAIGDGKLVLAISPSDARLCVIVATVLATAIYAAAVLGCLYLAYTVHTRHAWHWKLVTVGRILCIVMINVIVLAVAFSLPRPPLP